MSERTSYAPGTPCWVDLATPDLEAAESFYGELFGWEIPELPNSAEMGGYRRAKLGGKDVAGVMPLMQEGQPPAWSTYVSVDDADATAARGQENGGTVIAEPMDVIGPRQDGDLHRPEGAVFGIWQPGDLRRRRAGQRAGRLRLERAQHPRRRGGEGVLRRASSAGSSKTRRSERAGTYTIGTVDGDRSAACST